jgi:prepilin-type processing-associated H-X9-DG protein
MYWGSGSADPERRKKACAQNLRKVHLALEIYARDSGDKYPVAPGARTSEEALDVLVPRYSSDTSIFICPASRDSSLPGGESFRNRRISYAYFMGRRSGDTTDALMADRLIDTQAKGAGQDVFSRTGKAPGNNHKTRGGNFLLCDGSVQDSTFSAPFSLVLTQGVVLLNPKP